MSTLQQPPAQRESAESQIDSLLSEAEVAGKREDWPAVAIFAERVLALDPDNLQALAFHASARRELQDTSANGIGAHGGARAPHASLMPAELAPALHAVGGWLIGPRAETPRWLGLLVIGLLALTFIAQRSLAGAPLSFVAVAPSVLAVSGLAWVMNDPRLPRWMAWVTRPLPRLTLRTLLGVLQGRGGAIVLTLLAAAAVVVRMQDRPTSSGFGDIVLLWLLAVFGYILALRVPLRRPRWSDFRAVAHTREARVVGAILVVAALLRFVNLETIPHSYLGDEGVFAFSAMDAEAGRLTDPFATGWLSHPTMIFFLEGDAMRVIGDTVAGSRALSALGGVLGVLATYAWVRYTFGRPTALVAVVLLTGYDEAIYWSRNGLQNVWDTVWLPLTLLLLAMGIQGRRLWAVGAAGLVAGFAQYWYFGMRVVPLLGLALLVHAALFNRPRFRPFWRALALFIAGVAVAMLPLLVFYHQDPASYLARMDVVTSDTRAQAQATGQPLPLLVADHLSINVLAYFRYPPTTFFYTGRPLLDPLSGAFLLVGIAACVGMWRARGFAPLAGVALVIGALAFADRPPQAQELFTDTVPLLALVALGVVTTARLVATVAHRPERWALAAAGATALALAALNVWLLFADYLPSGRDEPGFTQVANELGYYLRDQGVPVTYYFFAEPAMSTTTHENLPFIARNARGIDVPPPPPTPPDYQLGPDETLFIFLPARLGELGAIAIRYPGPDPEVVNAVDGSPLFYVYRPDL